MVKAKWYCVEERNDAVDDFGRINRTFLFDSSVRLQTYTEDGLLSEVLNLQNN